MNASRRSRDVKPALVSGADPDDVFAAMRRENLARWPTGARSTSTRPWRCTSALPRAQAARAGSCARRSPSGRCLTQPRGGFGTFEMQRELMATLDQEGMADIVPTTTDSYTRNEQWALAQSGHRGSREAGRSMLNGYPMVNYGVARDAQADRGDRQAGDHADRHVDAASSPSEIGLRRRLLRLPRLGHRLHDLLHQGDVDRGRHPQLPVSRPARGAVPRARRRAAPAPAGLSHRHQHSAVHRDHHLRARCLLAAAQGVRNYGLELGETLHLVQDAAAIRLCRELVQEYLAKNGFHDVFTPVTSLHWMGAWPQDEAQAAALSSTAARWPRSAARYRHHQVDARGVRHSDAEGQRRRPCG